MSGWEGREGEGREREDGSVGCRAERSAKVCLSMVFILGMNIFATRNQEFNNILQTHRVAIVHAQSGHLKLNCGHVVVYHGNTLKQ